MPQKQQAPAGRICTHHPLQRGERREKSGEGREERGEKRAGKGEKRGERGERRERITLLLSQAGLELGFPKGGSAMIQAQNLSNLGSKMKMFSSHGMGY